MTASLLAIIPLFTLIGLGYLARRTILDVKMLPALNLFVYYFAVPALLFNAARRQTLDNLFNWPALAAFVLGIILTSLIAVLSSRYLFHCKSPPELVMRGLNSVFANFAYMGIPLTFSLLGASAATISIILAGNLFIIGGAQLWIEALRQHSMSLKQIWTTLDRSLLRNPIFLSTVLGLLASGFNLALPKVVNTTLDMLAPAAIPVALFCLGASLQFRQIQTSLGELSWLITLKLLVHPALTYFAFYLLGVTDPIWLVTTVLLTALPTGALVHVVAMRYNLFEQASSQLVVFSTLISLLSVTFWVNLMI
ncbi:AEC family transporter [uncultured Thiothrix sp.]|uniref:AEC family transporter n=1 Tax=uncultured Thiothrix sp. TaxID=223185 RepID=UPI00260E510B|nr:AEC family transporter [uncultured Thiothrix sp.]HMT92284.1 AEC family transporter [Thiolinea sp.]